MLVKKMTVILYVKKLSSFLQNSQSDRFISVSVRRILSMKTHEDIQESFCLQISLLIFVLVLFIANNI